MRLFICVVVLTLTTFSGMALHAEEIVFIGKTYSPNHMEVISPHATPEDMKIFDSMAKEVKEKGGEDAEPPMKPFTGRMKVTKMLADIGQKVDLEQHLLEYAFPTEDLFTERRKLSQGDLKSVEAELDRARADIATKRKNLEEARVRQTRGLASNQEVSDFERDIQIATMKAQTIDYNLRLEREMSKGELELAKAKFGSKTSGHNLSGVSWITSPVAGYVLWVNPEVKPGIILSKSTKLFVVGSMDPILIRALVYETYLPKLRVGDTAQVSFDTLPDKTFEATLVRIPMTATQTDVQLPSHFEVELSMPNPGLVLKEGMRGHVKIQVPDGPRE